MNHAEFKELKERYLESKAAAGVARNRLEEMREEFTKMCDHVGCLERERDELKAQIHNELFTLEELLP
jgi:uncharacterized protein Yka (UPF0111/DUF47 family)